MRRSSTTMLSLPVSAMRSCSRYFQLSQESDNFLRLGIPTRRTVAAVRRRFPYGVVYQILESEILVVAITHLHRRPGYWRDRSRT
jgi:hypothetical protein